MGGKHIIFTDKCADLCVCSSSLGLWFHLKAPFLFISPSFLFSAYSFSEKLNIHVTCIYIGHAYRCVSV